MGSEKRFVTNVFLFLIVSMLASGLGCASDSSEGRVVPHGSNNADSGLTSARVTSSGGASIAEAQAERYDGPKARIAVAPFEDETNARAGSDITMMTPMGAVTVNHPARPSPYGQGIGDMLATTLFQTKRFIVLERERLNVVLAEQDLAAEGRILQPTAAPTGQIEGAELLVLGSVTGYETNVRTRAWWAGLVPIIPVALIGGEKSTSRIAMDIRLVDTRSGRLVATTSVEGLVQEKEFGGGTIAGGGGRRRNKGPHEEAVRKALQAATGWIVSQTPADYYHYR